MPTSTKNRGLGRGLGELFQRTEPEPVATRPLEPAGGAPTGSGHGVRTAAEERSDAAPAPIPEGSYFAELPPESITSNPRQPRTVFDDDAMSELVESIAEVGLLQPIVVRPVGDQRFELVMGERRWRASQAAGLAAIPAIVRETEDHDLLRDALLENLHRAQLNPLEEAAAYAQMLSDFDCTQDELATRIKRSRPQISNTMRLLKLPPTVQRRVAAGVLSAGHARALLAPRGSRSAPSRRSSPWATPARTRRRRVGPGRRCRRPRPRRSPRGCPNGWTPGSASTSAATVAGSPSTSPRRTTWPGSSS